MSVGFNFHGDAPNVDRGEFTALVEKLRPAWLIVMNDLSYAKALAEKCPATNVIYRWVPADDEPLATWPEPGKFVDFALAEFGGAKLWACTSNEAGFSDELIQWTEQVIEIGAAKGLRLAVLGLSSGTPRPEEWTRAKRLLELCDQQRETVVVNLHEYWCGVVTSGFVGGEPGYIQPDVWPRHKPEMSRWHCGRFQFLLKACREMGIRAPRIVIGEHGADDMADVKFWTERLRVTPPYANIRSWKSLVDQWRDWWPGWSAERAYFEQIKYAEEEIYSGTAVEGQLLFAWTGRGAKWEAFDVSEAGELEKLLLERQADDEPLAPKYAVGTYTYSGANQINIRTEASKAAASLGKLAAGATVRVQQAVAKRGDGHVWQPVAVGQNGATISGWLAVDIVTLEKQVQAPVLAMFTKSELMAMASAFEVLGMVCRKAAARTETGGA